MSDRRLKIGAYASSLVLYLAVGYWLAVKNGFIIGDSLSRVFAAQTVLFSRDPHLAAIGFIFTPLTAMVQVPILLLNPWWPELTVRAFSATIMSAGFMAGAVVQIMSMGTDRGLPRGYSVTIAALFALNPMIVFYGSNGMSEAPFISFMSWAVRRLILWMRDDDVHHLITAGAIAMGLAYLTRYDAVACVAAAGLLVGVTTYRRARTPPRVRRAVLDVVLVSGPGFATFLLWAVVSWLITGEAFAQFTSQYGNAAILEQSGGGTAGLLAGVIFAATCMTLLAPALIPLAVWAGVIRWRQPMWTMLLPPVMIFGAALVFQTYSYATGSTFGFLRFYIIAIPFAACMAMLAVPDGVFVSSTRPGRYAPVAAMATSATTGPARTARWRFAAVAVTFAICLPMAGWGMSQQRYAPQEFALGAVLRPDPDNVSARKTDQRRVAATFSTERELARYLDDLQLPESSIIADTVYGFAVVAASARPRTFVVPSDQDFVTLLNDPAAHGIRTCSRCRTPAAAAPTRSISVSPPFTTTAPILRRWNWRPPMTVPTNRTGGSTE